MKEVEIYSEKLEGNENGCDRFKVQLISTYCSDSIEIYKDEDGNYRIFLVQYK